MDIDCYCSGTYNHISYWLTRCTGCLERCYNHHASLSWDLFGEGTRFLARVEHKLVGEVECSIWDGGVRITTVGKLTCQLTVFPG